MCCCSTGEKKKERKYSSQISHLGANKTVTNCWKFSSVCSKTTCDCFTLLHRDTEKPCFYCEGSLHTLRTQPENNGKQKQKKKSGSKEKAMEYENMLFNVSDLFRINEVRRHLPLLTQTTQTNHHATLWFRLYKRNLTMWLHTWQQRSSLWNQTTAKNTRFTFQTGDTV